MKHYLAQKLQHTYAPELRELLSKPDKIMTSELYANLQAHLYLNNAFQ
jgi:hypothetical protein